MAVKDYVSLQRLTDYTGFVKQYVGTKVAPAIKSITFDEHTKVLSFYKEAVVEDSSVPVKSVTIPETDVSNLLEKLQGATEGNVVSVGPDGTVVDGGVKVSDLATKDEVAAAASGHLSKAIVTQSEIEALIADSSTADANKIYLLKDDTATGEDVYKEYTLINNEVVCIGSTSTSLDGLATETALNAATARITALEEKVGDGFQEITQNEIANLWNEA